jgi:hypothetical protein
MSDTDSRPATFVDLAGKRTAEFMRIAEEQAAQARGAAPEPRPEKPLGPSLFDACHSGSVRAWAAERNRIPGLRELAEERRAAEKAEQAAAATASSETKKLDQARATEANASAKLDEARGKVFRLQAEIQNRLNVAVTSAAFAAANGRGDEDAVALAIAKRDEGQRALHSAQELEKAFQANVTAAGQAVALAEGARLDAERAAVAAAVQRNRAQAAAIALPLIDKLREIEPALAAYQDALERLKGLHTHPIKGLDRIAVANVAPERLDAVTVVAVAILRSIDGRLARAIRSALNVNV